MRAVVATGLAALCLGSATAWGAAITFNTALPVHQGGWVLREQVIYRKIADDATAARRDLRIVGVVSVLGYGVSRDLAVFGILPWFDKRLELRSAGQNLERGTQGFGDLSLMARYTAYERNSPGRTFRVAPFVAVKAPTGSDDARDRLGRLPPSLQPGSGAWDLLAGAVSTWQTLDFQLDGQLSYRTNGEANGFRAGDVVRFDGSLQYRLWPRRLAGGVPAFVYGVLEANLIHAARDRVGVTRDPSSGGTTLFVSPGLQYVTRKWIVEAGVQIPLLQDLHGTALGHDFGLSAGFRVNF